ncbi:MAG: GNAT family N-acetyltransferase [Acidimicrobiales bacterium]
MRIPERFKVGIARAQPSDTDDLLAWWRETYGSGYVDPGRRAWLYELNPCIGPDGPGPWLCRRDGKIVGQQDEIPFDLKVGDEIRPSVWAIDLSVDPAWRLRGVGPALMATVLEPNPIVCILDLTEQGMAAFRGAGCVEIGRMATYRRALDARRAVRMGGVPPALRRLAPLLVPAVRAADALAAGAIRLSGAKLVLIDRFDERADQVWEAASQFYPVMARRDLPALTWRIDQRPDGERLQRYYLIRRGRAVGWVVLRPVVRSGDAGVVVVDYLAPPRWVAPLLLAAGAAARTDGAVSLSVRTRNGRADRWLRMAGFTRRGLAHDLDCWMMVHCTAGTDVAVLVEDPAAWFVTAADSNLERVGTPLAEPVD